MMQSYSDRVSDAVTFPSVKSEQGDGRWNREFRHRLADRALALQPEAMNARGADAPLRAPACFGEQDGWPERTAIVDLRCSA